MVLDKNSVSDFADAMLGNVFPQTSRSSSSFQFDHNDTVKSFGAKLNSAER